jgi:DNA-binding transcriptional regulator YdaS (Cro superfamily)
MNLKEYFSDPDRKQADLAALLDCNPAQVSQWVNDENRKPDARNCLAIERVTNGLITRQELRPEDYWLIWPDLEAPAKTKEAA